MFKRIVRGCLAVALMGTWAQWAGAVVNVGDKPVLSFNAANGAGNVSLEKYKGKIIVVDFWATWCGPCLRSMPHLDQIARKHPEIDVLTINIDDAAEARAIFDRAHYQLQLLADDGATSDRFGVVSIPHTVLIDGKGMLRDTESGELEAQIRAIE